MTTILVVDDRATNREYLVTLLAYAGHRLLEAFDGAEALDIIRAERPDLVITDILMPTMDGLEFVQRLRADATPAHTPVIFYTATYLEREAWALAQACGVSHVLVKPAEPQVVFDAVNAACGATASPAQPLPSIAAELSPLSVISRKLAEKAGELNTLSLRLAALVKLHLEIGLERNPQRVLEKFCQAVRKIIGAKYAAIGILEGAGQTLGRFITSGLDAETIARIGAPPEGKGLLGHLLAERRPLRVPDIAADPRSVGFPAHHPPMCSFLGVPIASATRVYGRLYVTDKLGADEFSEEDEQVATALAAQVAVAYENAWLYDEIQRHAADLKREAMQRQRVETQLRHAETKYRALVEHVPSVTYRAALDQVGAILYISPQIEALLGYSAHEWLTDPGLAPARCHADDRERVVAEKKRSRATGAPLEIEYRFVARDGRVVWVRDESILVRSEFGQPLFIQGILLDVTERKRAAEELRLSRDRLADLSRCLVEVHETAQRAIGRELHDQIGQMLTALKITLEIAPQIPPEQAAKKLAGARELLDELINRVSVLSLELRPPMLDDLGLIPALLWHVTRFQEQTGIAMDFKHSGAEGIRFDSEIETTAYRIIQESLTNVARHAHATRARLEVQVRDERMEIQIEDNGVGFDPQAAFALNRGLGGMRERVSLLDGSFHIESQPGKGAKKFIELPLKEETQ